MRCAVITGPKFEDIQQQIELAKTADMLEFRWDLFDSLDYIPSYNLPAIFTLRSRSQGGHFSGTEEERLNALEKLIGQQPTYVDIEYFVPKERVINWNTKIIRSFHDFEKTPDDLDGTLRLLKQTPADIYKIAVMANTTHDMLRMLRFLKSNPMQVIGISMGEKGFLTRVLRQHWTYCAVNETTAPGQLSLRNIPKKPQKIYGLIGDPVDKSVSHITHNALLAAFEDSSFYQKMLVKKEDLEQCINQMKDLPFHGLSVTMPLKETIMPFLDKIDSEAQAIGAVNTLVIKENRICGYNTDGLGAMKAIQAKMNVKGKQVIVLGAGGAARAIVYTLKQNGASVTVLNRDVDKAKKLAAAFYVQSDSLEAMSNYAKQGYDLLINCTPTMPISSEYILKGSVVMETRTLPKNTPFIEAAVQRNCRCIYGYEMFVHQAVQQFALWKSWPVKEVEKYLTELTQAAII